MIAVAALLGCGRSNPPTQTAVTPVLVAWQGKPKAAAARAFDTPQAVFQVYHDATHKGDWQAASRYLTPESQAMMADALIMGASFSTADDKKKEADLTQLLKRYGIDLDADPGPAATGSANRGGMPALSARVKNKPAFIGEIGAWQEKNGGGRGPDFRVEKLTALEVKGNSAAGVVQTARGERPIEFHRTNAGWLISLPNRKLGAADPVAPAAADGKESDARQTACTGTFWMGNKAHPLKHAIAYRTKFVDDPCTAVVMTTQPIRPRELQQLKNLLQKEGSDDAFFVSGVSLKVVFDDAGAVRHVFGWADNDSIDGNSGVDAQVERQDGRIKGRAAMKVAEPVANGLKHRFEVQFDVELMP